MKKIISLNVNGLRSAILKGFTAWIKENDFDIICLQEIKMDSSYADPDFFINQGYYSYWHCATKKGYSGVMILSKEKINNIFIGTGNPEYDQEGRVIRADIGDWSIINAYFPSGSSGEERHDFKMKFIQDFYPWIKELLYIRKKIILVGDYNIVHQAIDIHNPERKDNPSGYRPEERAWLNAWFSELFDDSFRILFPHKQEFSWWSYRAGSYQKNKGWRIDYQSISKPFSDCVLNYKHHHDIRFSDHCPIEGNYNLI